MTSIKGQIRSVFNFYSILLYLFSYQCILDIFVSSYNIHTLQPSFDIFFLPLTFYISSLESQDSSQYVRGKLYSHKYFDCKNRFKHMMLKMMEEQHQTNKITGNLDMKKRIILKFLNTEIPTQQVQVHYIILLKLKILQMMMMIII